MSGSALAAMRITPESNEYQSLQVWPFPDEPFYVRQVRELLATDIPQRVARGDCTIWIYHDPAAGGDPVGFGTLCTTDLYQEYAGKPRHHYIPLLAVHPAANGRGYGRRIVEHLVEQAGNRLKLSRPEIASDLLFLDVYVANTAACHLYTAKCGFTCLNPDTPIADASQNNEPYFIMARRILPA